MMNKEQEKRLRDLLERCEEDMYTKWVEKEIDNLEHKPENCPMMPAGLCDICTNILRPYSDLLDMEKELNKERVILATSIMLEEGFMEIVKDDENKLEDLSQEETDDYIRNNMNREEHLRDYMKKELKMIYELHPINNIMNTQVLRTEAKLDLIIDMLYTSVGGDPRELNELVK